MSPSYIEILDIVILQIHSEQLCEYLYCFHKLWLYGNTRRSCPQFVFLVRIGWNFELAARRHLLFSEVWLRVDKLLQGRRILRIKHVEIRKIRVPCYRNVTSSSIDLAISTSLIQSIVTWGSTVRLQTSVLKVDFPALKFHKVMKFSKVPFRTKNSRVIHHTIVRISSTSMTYHSTSTLEVNWLNRRVQRFSLYDPKFHFYFGGEDWVGVFQWFPFHCSPWCLWNIRFQILRWKCQIFWIVEDCLG